MLYIFRALLVSPGGLTPDVRKELHARSECDAHHQLRFAFPGMMILTLTQIGSVVPRNQYI